nr:LamG domain-containing protein [Planctomycetota bacterium]
MFRKLIYLVSFILVLNLALVSGAKAADPNLVGMWPLNEGSGDTAIDLSGNGNDGTINNADTGGLGDGGSVWVDDPERGTVISFNGTADSAFVRAGNIPQMTLTNDFTWSFWAKHSEENTADNDIILGNRMDENAVDFVPRQFIKFTPTKFEWHMNGNGDDNLDYDDIPTDIWLHHAVVKTAEQLTYYRNGIEGGSGTITQPLDFPQPLYFGGDNEGADGENWSGLMSDVSIYDRALSADEIGQLAGTPVDPGTDGLVAYYALENDVLDSSGNGNDGTIVGAPIFVDGPEDYGMAMEFDGESYVDVGNDASLDITGPISMGIWIRPSADDPEGNGTEAAVMAKADSAGSPSWSWQVRY